MEELLGLRWQFCLVLRRWGDGACGALCQGQTATEVLADPSQLYLPFLLLLLEIHFG